MKLQQTTVRNSWQRISGVSRGASECHAERSGTDQRFSGCLSGSVASLGTMRGDLESIRQALGSGDSTVLGLVAGVEWGDYGTPELQINETLFRLWKAWNRCGVRYRPTAGLGSRFHCFSINAVTPSLIRP